MLLQVFDYVDMGDAHIPQFSVAYKLVQPYKLLLICMYR